MKVALTRQTLISLTILSAWIATVSLQGAETTSQNEVLQIGSRLELFIDSYLIDTLNGVELKMHTPQLAPPTTTPIKGSCVTVIKDGDLYRAYYRAGVWPDGLITCYAESNDGHNWNYPELNIYPNVEGPDGRNVILANKAIFSTNFSPFLDSRPGIPEGERFKALAGQVEIRGLWAFVSADGIHWKKMHDKPVIPTNYPVYGHSFDSPNAPFWSEAEQSYVCYFRTYKTSVGNLRSISRTVSQDFINWSLPAVPTNPNAAGEHLYTNTTHPYFRAPHIYIALPTRVIPKRDYLSFVMFMTWRSGSTRYDRTFMEPMIRPGADPDSWGNRANHVARYVAPTGEREMSMWHVGSGRRYTLRTDGFASINAGASGGEMVSKVLAFTGEKLVVNCSTSAAGSIRIEIQSPDGKAISKFGMSDCKPIIGDKIEGIVSWKQGSAVGSLSGKPVRLRFDLKDADIYSIRFR